MYIQEKAQKLLNKFEFANVWRIRNKHWHDNDIQELIHYVCKENLPDNYSYQFIVETLDAIVNSYNIPDEELTEHLQESGAIKADAYFSNLTAWLNSSPRRFYYLTKAIKEYGNTFDGFQMLHQAQQNERNEVATLVLEYLRMEKK